MVLTAAKTNQSPSSDVYISRGAGRKQINSPSTWGPCSWFRLIRLADPISISRHSDLLCDLVNSQTNYTMQP